MSRRGSVYLTAERKGSPARPGLFLIFLSILLVTLWLGGGASRPDVPGQLLVRSVSWISLIVVILVGGRPTFGDVWPVALLLLAGLVLALAQLVPLPPGLWQALPGRALLVDAARVSGEGQPWRPWSIVPGATINAASSLIVPIVTLLLANALHGSDRRAVAGLLLGLIVASAMAGLLQFSGTSLENPLVNGTPGDVSGLFANRNHFALFIALGCVLAPAWAFQEDRRPRWRAPVALALVPLLALVILASGSRAGIILGVLGIGMGLALAQRGIRRELGRYPRWAAPALVLGVVLVVAAVVAISVAAGRAVSIDRAVMIDPGQDIRSRGLPTVLAMVREYWPAGSGLGGFDPVFRIHEPPDLLKLTYFNHAHDDFLEVVLDSGLPGLLLILAGLGWWARASFRAWRNHDGIYPIAARLGSALLLLVIVASVFDYPGRTPLIMAMSVIAAVWLSTRVTGERGSALPGTGQHL